MPAWLVPSESVEKRPLSVFPRGWGRAWSSSCCLSQLPATDQGLSHISTVTGKTMVLAFGTVGESQGSYGPFS